MSTVINSWLGRQKAVAQVDTVTIGTNDAATTYTLTFPDGTVVSVPGDAGGAASTATDLAAAWNALAETDGRFGEATAAATSGGALTLTGNTPGLPFGPIVASVSGGTGTISHVATTANKSPSDAGDPANWSSGVLPQGAVAAPTSLAAVAESGGSLVDAATYYWVVTAINAHGETTVSNEVSLTIAGTNQTAGLSWAQTANATGYKVYRGTASLGENTLITTIASGATVTYSDTGTAGTSATPPAANTAIADDVFIGTSGRPALLWNLSASVGTLVNSLTISQNFDGQVGLPKWNNNGYPEYRPDYWQLAAPTIAIGGETGSGSSLCKLDAQALGPCAFNIYNTGASIIDGEAALQLLGTYSTGINLYVAGGSVDIAMHGGEAAKVGTFQIGNQTLGLVQNVVVRCGAGVTLGTVQNYGGSLELNSGLATLKQFGTAASTRINAGGISALLELDEGEVQYLGNGTIAAISLGGGETPPILSFAENNAPRTVSAIDIYGPAQVLDGGKTVSWPTWINFHFFNPFAKAGLDFGANIKMQVQSL